MFMICNNIFYSGSAKTIHCINRSFGRVCELILRLNGLKFPQKLKENNKVKIKMHQD